MPGTRPTGWGPHMVALDQEIAARDRADTTEEREQPGQWPAE
ncbi:hypothetical protein [Streptomyces sp. NBC_00268]|nr:hypothetical protein [Streptomyces sp. NBC_00268]MCX5190914.1 hypothetical protein [Streptomyces sp. NBC_00268]